MEKTLNNEENNKMTNFEKELTRLINCHSVENMSNTPDFLLALYLRKQLELWAELTLARDSWYGVLLYPGACRFPKQEDLIHCTMPEGVFPSTIEKK